MIAAVTGPTGSIGTELIASLLEAGYGAIAVVRPDSKRTINLPRDGRVRVVECDISDYESMMGKERCDLFFHLAWMKTSGGGRDDVYSQTDNIRYSLDAVRLAHSWGAKAFVGTGSQAEYGPVTVKLNGDTPVNPESGYGIAKYASGKMCGMLCSQLGMRFCWARILSVYGPNDADTTFIRYLIRSFRNGEVPKLTPCEQIWDYIYSRDAADALLAIGERGKDGKTYCIGSGTPRPMKEYVEEIRSVVDPDGSVEYGAIDYYPHQPMYLCADISDLTEDTGFSPKVPFAEGIRKIVGGM